MPRPLYPKEQTTFDKHWYKCYVGPFPHANQPVRPHKSSPPLVNRIRDNKPKEQQSHVMRDAPGHGDSYLYFKRHLKVKANYPTAIVENLSIKHEVSKW